MRNDYDRGGEARRIIAGLETNGTRRCLVCSRINPCAEHSQADQRAELARNDAEIARIRDRFHTPDRDR